MISDTIGPFPTTADSPTDDCVSFVLISSGGNHREQVSFVKDVNGTRYVVYTYIEHTISYDVLS